MRRGLITLLTAALALTCALPAEAAKRKVPRGFYGVMWNRAAAAVPAELHDAEFARMARRASRRCAPCSTGRAPSPRRGPPSFTETDHVVALAARRAASTCCRS